MKSTYSLFAATCWAALAATSAFAQDTYVSVYGGLSNLSNIDLQGDVATAAGVGPQSVTVQSDDGFTLGVAVGQELSSFAGGNIRGEVELTYGKSSTEDTFFSGNGTAAEINTAGDLATTRLFANVIADFETGGAITPYVGAGIGASRSTFDISYGPGVILDDESSNFSSQLILGASYDISETISLFGDVRFIRDFDVDTDRFSPTGALTGNISDDVNSTNLNVGLTFQF